MVGVIQRAFQALIQHHRKILDIVGDAYCRDAPDREDLARAIAAQLWRSFASFDARVKFSTWRYRIALNLAISAHRAETIRKRQILFDDEPLLSAINDPTTDPAELRTIHQVIASPDVLSRALMLLYLDGASTAEIAPALGRSLGLWPISCLVWRLSLSGRPARAIRV